MKIGFLTNKLTLRGTEVAVYDYAHHNEKLLGNESIIITRSFSSVQNSYDVEIKAYKKFEKRFPKIFYYDQMLLDEIIESEKIDVLYIIKSGGKGDNLFTSKCKCVIHCVFDLNDPHGDVYAAISSTLNQIWNTSFPVVPHMIDVGETSENLRKALGIHENNLVFGRYGGRESFDIVFAKEVVYQLALENSNITFIFMNTFPFCKLGNVLFIQGTDDMLMKRRFINTCDAMIHARQRGESFGLSCGEFAVCGKPVITFGDSKERNHLDVLGEKALVYRNKDELYKILKEFDKNKCDMQENGYKFYTPENVMKIFKQVFLD